MERIFYFNNQAEKKVTQSALTVRGGNNFRFGRYTVPYDLLQELERTQYAIQELGNELAVHNRTYINQREMLRRFQTRLAREIEYRRQTIAVEREKHSLALYEFYQIYLSSLSFSYMAQINSVTPAAAATALGTPAAATTFAAPAATATTLAALSFGSLSPSGSSYKSSGSSCNNFKSCNFIFGCSEKENSSFEILSSSSQRRKKV